MSGDQSPAPGKNVALSDSSQCTIDRTVEAVILYPSLGMPMVLGPKQKVCSLIIATKGRCWKGEDTPPEQKDAHEYVDRHLRLTAIDQPKGAYAKNTERGELCEDGVRYNIAKGSIRVWHLGSLGGGGGMISNRHGFPVAVLARGLTVPQGPYAGLTDIWEVEIDLEKSGLMNKITDQEFLNWAWLVKTTSEHKKILGQGHGPSLAAAALRDYHEPQDRMISGYLCGLADHYDSTRLYEVDLPKDEDKDEGKYPMPLAGQGEAKRLQSWHPVIRATKLPLKLAHLTDIHINVRQGALAKSRASVIENPTGVSKDPIGKKVAHTFWSVKALIEQMAEKKRGMDTALLLTGDYIDFNRNIDPGAVGDKIGEQWKQFNVLARANDDTLYRRGYDDTLMYSLVREAYTKHKLPVFMVNGNHEGYQFPYGISPRKGLWAIELGALELFDQSTEGHKRELEAASQWVEGKGNEGIPADHNLTIYEATLAYGPTYGQVLTSNNFSKDQFDWFHTLFTPFSDAVLALGANADKNGADAQQILALLGWGAEENYKNFGDLPVVGWGGVDAQGAGILPRAAQSFNRAQLLLLSRASDIKKATGNPFVLGTHFTMINYHSKTAFNKKGMIFTPRNEATGYREERLLGSAFNEANHGTCERNQCEFYSHFVFGEAGNADWHLSGHSHRAGVYRVKKKKGLMLDDVELIPPASDPGLSGKITLADGGTRFVVSSSAGPIGGQNLEGEFDGGLLRPPSGSLIDVKAKSVEQIKTVRPGKNEKPRLCVILDYLAVMNPGKDIVPIRFEEWGPVRPASSWKDVKPFAAPIGFRISEEMVNLKCLNLEGMKIWVFKETKTNKDGFSGEWLKLEVGKWIKKKKGFLGKKESETEWVLVLPESAVKELESCLMDAPVAKPVAGQDKAEWEVEMKSAQERFHAKGSSNHFIPYKRVLQAFCEIPLNVPEIAGKEDLNCDDPWIFPLAIGIRMVDYTPRSCRCYFRRPFGEKGEVPDWGFRAKYFANKGYVEAGEAIRPPKEKNVPGNTEDTLENL